MTTMKELTAALWKMQDEFDADLVALGAKYTGKDGKQTELLKQLVDLSPGERSIMGDRFNRFTRRVQNCIDGEGPEGP